MTVIELEALKLSFQLLVYTSLYNGHIFSDKFVLDVVNLTQIDLATDEDKLYQIETLTSKVDELTTEKNDLLSEK